MATAEAGICNLALARIGQANFIDSLDEDSAPGKACKAVYGFARNIALTSFPWPFATGRKTLGLLASVVRDGWSFAYAVPTDLLAPRHIWTGSRSPLVSEDIPYTLEANDNGDGEILLTDQPGALLVYTRAVRSPAVFPPLFVDALACLLARELVMPLSLRADLGEAMNKRWLVALSVAAAQAMRESSEAAPVSELVSVR